MGAVDTLRAQLEPAGFDLAQPFAVQWYNDAVPADVRLPTLGRASTLAVLVGNTRALWPPFCEHRRRHPEQRDALDHYTVSTCTAAARTAGVLWEARFAFEAPPRRIAMQRAAVVSGLAAMGDGGLAVHAVYGPWIALRAVIVLNLPGPAVKPAPSWRCVGCARGCGPAVQRALAGEPSELEAWQRWLRAREACPTGREHRYPDPMIEFHYRHAFGKQQG